MPGWTGYKALNEIINMIIYQPVFLCSAYGEFLSRTFQADFLMHT
jgi:hypothetical protein